jgi:hypothetical protein
MGDLEPELLIESRRRNLVALRTKRVSAEDVLQARKYIPCGGHLKCGTLMVIGPGYAGSRT